MVILTHALDQEDILNLTILCQYKKTIYIWSHTNGYNSPCKWPSRQMLPLYTIAYIGNILSCFGGPFSYTLIRETDPTNKLKNNRMPIGRKVHTQYHDWISNLI